MKKMIKWFCTAMLMMAVVPSFAQGVSNDNEDEVNKVDARMAMGFVPGQVLVRFKDESNIQVLNFRNGKFRAASNNAIDGILREFGVDEMEKLFPTAVAKPKYQLRKKVAPNGAIVEERNLDKVFWIKTTVIGRDSTMQLIKRLQELPEVEYAEPNYIVHITAEMPDMSAPANFSAPIRKVPVSTETEANVICSQPSRNPLYFRQYGITQQNIHQLWNKPIINKKRPVIAILDTGVDISHPDLIDNIWTNTAEAEGEAAYDDDRNGIVDDEHGWNFVDNYYDLTDRNGHGTHCAGIAAAADNSIGIVGANPLALIMPVKVMSDRGTGDVATIARGIRYAVDNGADVLSMSFGGPSLSATAKDALDYAYQTAILVAAAGNNGKNIYDMYNPPGTSYPAAYYLVLGVEASASNLQRASFSNYDPDGPIYSEDGIDGRNYEIQVPGAKIYSTLPNGRYDQLSGTSMSTPLFAGAVSALLMVKDYPSRDVLYGDLIHLKADFAKIYSDETPRTPKIDLVALNVDDNVDGNTNIDGQVDVGETIRLYPVLRNTWADATDIQLQLTVDPIYASFVEIENPQVDFGHSISAYGRATAATPIRVRFADNIGNNTRIKFTLEVSCPESNEHFTQDTYVTVNNMVKLYGFLTEDMTLTADHEYLVSSNLGIPEGVTLTIEPGTVVRFNANTNIANGGTLIADGTPEKPIYMLPNEDGYWNEITYATLRYCKLQHFKRSYPFYNINYENCIITDMTCTNELLAKINFCKVNLIDCNSGPYVNSNSHTLTEGQLNNCNIINNYCRHSWYNGYYRGLYLTFMRNPNNNWVNSYYYPGGYGPMLFGNPAETPETIVLESTPYLGTAREDLLRPYIFEMGNEGPSFSYSWFDLTNLRTIPVAEAHGMVWKVLVNEKDAQDEFEELAPLGVGKHKFEIYFNRPMNKLKEPQITFGVREPYTQHSVNEEGDDSGWNEEGTIYTAYVTITGRTMSDGVNRIYVQGAEDDEYFECPYEKTRFNINIQAAGSMATGFAAEPGLGRVYLTWDNSNNDFEDAMGFNVYRYTIDDEGHADTLRVNTDIIDTSQEAYTDYDVTPGETYYYYYKVLSTDLKEFDISNVVAATPLTSTLGDANGSGEVDVADVITTVNYAAGMDPKPFIFEAADYNTDQSIDILDVVGIIQYILQPGTDVKPRIAATATYTVEDGIVYVETPVALAGVQLCVNIPEQVAPAVMESLNGFEHASAWLTDEDYLFLAFNMNGKVLPAGRHALLNIGQAQLRKICLSDAYGTNVMAEAGNATAIDMLTPSLTKAVRGIYNLKGQKVAGKAEDLQRLPRGIYIIDGKKIVK